MPTFPRTLVPHSVTFPKVPTGLVSRARTGVVQLRAEISAGRTWRETWPVLAAGNTNTGALIAFVEDAYNLNTTFDITHYLLPGSGKAPNGTGGGTPLVNGATQSGSSIATDGWPQSVNGNMLPGDVFTIAGLNQLFVCTASVDSDGATPAAATVALNPPIMAGAYPANNAALTLTSNTIRAYIADYNPAGAAPDEYIAGFWVQFNEAP